MGSEKAIISPVCEVGKSNVVKSITNHFRRSATKKLPQGGGEGDFL